MALKPQAIGGDGREFVGKAVQQKAPKTKSLPREEVRQAFRKEPNSDWEEECRCSYRRPWEEERVIYNLEALREEVHCFDDCDHTTIGVIEK